MSQPEVTRFAPSPSGYLHLGHAYSALFAAWVAGPGGRFLLRIEDIDGGRARPEYEAGILEDLAWLGLQWETPVWRQSARLADYAVTLDRLRGRGLIYPCFCTRKEIAAEIERAGAAPHGPAEAIYPGICRHLRDDERSERVANGQPHALRLDMAKAIAVAEAAHGGPLFWHDRARGVQRCDPSPQGDVVLARKDIATSYHLAVVVDDAAQGATVITRGEDLFEASHIHRLLQQLLDLPVPEYHHHQLITDGNGQRLAKRNDALSIRQLRETGHSPRDVIALCGLEELPA